MKRNKLFLLPLFMLLLAGCKPEPSSSTPPVSEEPPPSISVVEKTVEPATIAELRAKTSGWDNAQPAQKEQEYEVTGTVTHKFRGAVHKDSAGKSHPAWNISIQDDDHNALLLYSITEEDYAADFADVKIGDKLTVNGFLATYGGLRELDGVSYVSHEEGTAITPVELASIKQSDLVDKDSLLVKIPDLKLTNVQELEVVVDGTFITYKINITLSKGGEEISPYMHYNIPLADAEDYVALLETVKSTDTLTWTGIIGINNKTFQLTAAHKDEWDITKGGDVVLTGIAFEDEEADVLVGETLETVLLPTPHDAELTGVVYSSDDTDVATVDGEGVVTGVAPGKAEIKAVVGAFEATMEVTVIDPATLEASVVLTADALGLAAYGAITDVEVDGVKWSGVQLGSFGDGIQIRTKDGVRSTLYNTTATELAVKTVTITYTAGKFPHKVDMYGATAKADVLDADPVLLYEDEDTAVISHTYLEADDIHFLHFTKNEDQYSGYIASIRITFYEVEPYALTADALGLAAYAAITDVDVNGVKWSGVQLGSFGDGIQIRTKDGVRSTLYNTTAFADKVKKVTIEYTAGKFPHKVDMYGAKVLADVLDADPVLLYVDEDTAVVSHTYLETDDVFFLHFTKHEDQYSGYISSIVIEFF